MMPCRKWVSAHASKRCCDVHCVRMAAQKPRPDLHHAGRPSRYSNATKRSIRTSDARSVRRVNKGCAASVMLVFCRVEEVSCIVLRASYVRAHGANVFYVEWLRTRERAGIIWG